MADLAVEEAGGPLAEGAARRDRMSRAVTTGGGYAAALVLVALATVLAFGLQRLAGAPNLTLLYVLPVVICAVAFGWRPALLAVLTGVLAFDYFFTAPFYSLRIDSPDDMVAAALLLAIAAIVSSVAGEARRRTVEAGRAAEQAEALQGLAHTLVEGRPRAEILQSAAAALHQVFRAPSVILVEDAGALRPAATAGGPRLTQADEEAALGAMTDHIHTRAWAYPFERSEFEFWPLATAKAPRAVIGVDFSHGDEERPPEPERFVEVVEGYLALALQPDAPRRL